MANTTETSFSVNGPVFKRFTFCYWGYVCRCLWCRELQITFLLLERIEMLTCSTAGAALSIRNSSVSTGDQGAGDLTAHGSRVLQKDRLNL